MALVVAFSVLIGAVFGEPLLTSGNTQSGSAQMPSPSYAPPWEPKEADLNGVYVGSSTCIGCHKEMKDQLATPMANALEPVADCQVLLANPLLTFRSGPYTYRIVREANRSIYTVTDGTTTISEPILYCFGQGEAGQTYVFMHGGTYYESRVSFYKAIKGLDITLGAPRATPKSLAEAMGNPMASNDARDCFGCHTTAAAGKSEMRIERMIPGVTCESCHGPGEKHAASMRKGELKEKFIYNPSSLDAEELSNFCGSCHRTWEQVVLMQQPLRSKGQELGKNSVRFQPYRIVNSPCYDGGDSRISCTACHDPHKKTDPSPASYDSKCAACHNAEAAPAQAEKRVAKICRVGKQNCVTCHMPKTELTGSHFKFTDHHIRVVRPDELMW